MTTPPFALWSALSQALRTACAKLPGVYAHNLQHAREDAEQVAAAERSGQPKPPIPIHDDSNCSIHRVLHLPTISVGWVPLLVFLGLFVAFLTEIAPPLVSQRLIFRIDCRGPPVC